jgi:sulfite reductase (NADPH) flavoprotein alpha-component
MSSPVSTLPAQVPPIVKSLLGEARGGLLARLVEGLDAQSLNWLSGYLAGLSARAPAQESTPAPQATPESRLTLV